MKDILLNKDLNLEIVEGDLLLGDTIIQRQNLLLVSSKGDFKERPDIGVGLQDYLLDEGNGNLFFNVKNEFKKDGLNLKKMEINNEKIIIESNEL